MLAAAGRSGPWLLAQTATPAYLLFHSRALYPIPHRPGAGAATAAEALVLIGVGPRPHFAPPWLGAVAKAALPAVLVPLPSLLGAVAPLQVRRALARVWERRRRVVV